MTEPVQTKYPIYVISKSRASTLWTVRTLEECGCTNYRLVIEPHQYEDYKVGMLERGFDPAKLLLLPFSNLGLGSIPVRNWVWEHSISLGAKRHWILDDNMRYFYRVYRNTRMRVKSMIALKVAEDYSDRFTNVAMSGLNYHFFVPNFLNKEPAYFNTRIYSCILLDNTIDERWRVLEWDGKPAPFNEDTDLSLQILKKGYCTILLNSFTVGKAGTHTMKGGNTEAVYKVGNKEEFDNRYSFVASLHKAHPDCVTIAQKWGRHHHHVDFSHFMKYNKLILKPGLTWPEVYEHKLKLVKLDDPKNMMGSYTDATISDVRIDLE